MATIAGERATPAPAFNPETEPYWRAAAEGRLLLRRGRSGRLHDDPRAICPFDMSDTNWWTNFVDCDLDALRIGMDVRVVFKATDDAAWTLPCFTPA